MIIFLNHQPLDFNPDNSLFDLLQQNGYHEKKGIAVAVNDEVIAKSEWAGFPLKNADKITLITATQGG